ncbi:MAG: transposase [Betaproteobacteria bacterium]
MTAVTLVAEVGKFSRFRSPRLLMGYGGLIPSEYSSGGSRHQGGITKAGNAHLRRALIEAAWAYRHRPAVKGNLRIRQQGADPEVKAIALNAQERPHRKFCRLTFRGKPSPVAMTAIARELVGFV